MSESTPLIYNEVLSLCLKRFEELPLETQNTHSEIINLTKSVITIDFAKFDGKDKLIFRTSESHIDENGYMVEEGMLYLHPKIVISQSSPLFSKILALQLSFGHPNKVSPILTFQQSQFMDGIFNWRGNSFTEYVKEVTIPLIRSLRPLTTYDVEKKVTNWVIQTEEETSRKARAELVFEFTKEIKAIEFVKRFEMFVEYKDHLFIPEMLNSRLKKPIKTRLTAQQLGELFFRLKKKGIIGKEFSNITTARFLSESFLIKGENGFRSFHYRTALDMFNEKKKRDSLKDKILTDLLPIE